MMLTNRQRQAIRAFAVGCLILVVGIAIWVASGSPTTSPICDEGSKAEISQCPRYNIVYVTLWHITQIVEAAEGFILALATIANCLVH
jgi:hypothetical protein